MLKFAEGNPTTRDNLVQRRMLCAEAQRQCDNGEDIIVPDGVEVIVFPDHAFHPQRAAA